SLQNEYWQAVVQSMLTEIKEGHTPNPDILCNQRVKFGAFCQAIDSSLTVASGHYARSEKVDGNVHLHTAPDAIKDQTYFLSHLSQAQLSRVMFPLGTYTKAKVRALAHKFNLPNKERKDSQGICFLGKLKFTDFIKYHLGERPGALIEWETGTKVGTHQGY